MRILSNLEEIKHIICELRMTLNIHTENEEYVEIYNYKGSALSLIRINDIKKLFGDLIFIPNVMGTLVKKNNNKEIVNPTSLWMKWDFIPTWIDNGGLSFEFKNGIESKILDEDKKAKFYNEKFLVIRQDALIHWKMYIEFIKLHNKSTYDVFMKEFGNVKQFGKNNNENPSISDYIQYMKDVGGNMNVKLIEPSYMTILIKRSKIQEYLDKQNKEIDINPSIKHLFKNNESSSSSNTKKQSEKVS
ncbi:MAG TPA: hypothetical protein PKD00_01500 [Burkholderiales bacterium]|nr:hypothetical protein [Burkholderiales bacterium]